MNIPNKIKIGAIVYDVVMQDEVDDGDSHGKIDWNRDEIVIDENLSIGNQERAFLHEMIHAINTQLDEGEVDYLAGALHQILKENDLIR